MEWSHLHQYQTPAFKLDAFSGVLCSNQSWCCLSALLRPSSTPQSRFVLDLLIYFSSFFTSFTLRRWSFDLFSSISFVLFLASNSIQPNFKNISLKIISSATLRSHSSLSSHHTEVKRKSQNETYYYYFLFCVSGCFQRCLRLHTCAVCDGDPNSGEASEDHFHCFENPTKSGWVTGWRNIKSNSVKLFYSSFPFTRSSLWSSMKPRFEQIVTFDIFEIFVRFQPN